MIIHALVNGIYAAVRLNTFIVQQNITLRGEDGFYIVTGVADVE